jgi:uncharacterized caspase-like protein
MTAGTPSKWAVLIGINGYHESLGELAFCVNDAKLMRDTLVSEVCQFAAEHVVLLTDDQPKDRQPTYGNIHSWLGARLSRPAESDLVLVYFAGHGREMATSALLAPIDATLDSLPVTGIPLHYVRELLERCKASQKVLILDACHSGAGRDVATMTAHFRESLDVGRGIYTIASCDADQVSHEWPEKSHGVFTYFLAEGILGSSQPDAGGKVTLDSVYSWVRHEVMDWTAGHRVTQEPVRACRTVGDIEIGRRGTRTPQDAASDVKVIMEKEATGRTGSETSREGEEPAPTPLQSQDPDVRQAASHPSHVLPFPLGQPAHGSATPGIVASALRRVVGLLRSNPEMLGVALTVLGGIVTLGWVLGDLDRASREAQTRREAAKHAEERKMEVAPAALAAVLRGRAITVLAISPPEYPRKGLLSSGLTDSQAEALRRQLLDAFREELLKQGVAVGYPEEVKTAAERTAHLDCAVSIVSAEEREGPVLQLEAKEDASGQVLWSETWDLTKLLP